MDNPMDNWEESFKQLNEKCASIEPLAQAADKLGVKPIIIAAVVVSFLLGFMLFGVGGSVLVNFVGFLYPAYESFKVLEESDQVDQMRFWLKYWVVFASFTLLESCIDYILFWLPMYYMFKMVFIVWLFLPKTRGADILFTNVIAPVLRNHRHAIDSKMDEAARRVGESLKKK
eukprot:GEMP01043865.1.p1 GENE.GEMP01043865.1~~GEMP01043865.1.p1  ORF type:complete len:173 (+),score=43.28 GEMP01043865.1:46-564(+)